MVAVEKKALVSQYDHVVFYDKALSTFNGKIFISHPIESDLNCSVVADDLINILKTIDSEEVTLELKDNVLVVHSDDVSAELSTEVYEDSVVKTIKSMNIGGMDWDNAGDVPKDFIQGIANCKFSVSRDVSCYQNTGCIHIVDNAVESTDGYRCTEYIMDGGMEEMLIPISSAVSLGDFNPVSFIKSNGWCHFMDTNDVIFSVAIIDGEYPDLSKIFSETEQEVSISLPVQIANVLSEFGKLSSGESDVFKFMNVTIGNGKIICKTNKQGCNVTKKIDFPAAKESVDFSISPTLLNSVLAKTNTIGVNRTKNLAVFSSENFTHVLTLPQTEQEMAAETTKEVADDEIPF
jgi:DNA polymerase III sliding clamp (beta) subunit (PCNA family)